MLSRINPTSGINAHFFKVHSDIPRQINPVPRIDTYFFKIRPNIALQPRGVFPVGLPVNILRALLPSSILPTCHAHLNLLDLITLTILGERYKL